VAAAGVAVGGGCAAVVGGGGPVAANGGGVAINRAENTTISRDEQHKRTACCVFCVQRWSIKDMQCNAAILEVYMRHIPDFGSRRTPGRQ